MRLKRLIQQIEQLEVKGSKEVEITGLTAHSKLVAPGNLFIAKKGQTHDGAQFIPDAIAAGASVILTDMYDPFLEVTQLIHPDIPSIEAKLAACYYHNPSHELKMIGITGTNGKTTVGFLLKALFNKTQISVGMIGTIEWVIGDHLFPGSMTTPDVITCQKLLRDMAGAGCKLAIMEVSSHGLDQDRVSGIAFDIALFTNLTQDHLDYHGDMETYRAAKEKLFANLSEEKWAIFNADDPTQFPTKAKVFTYGIRSDANLRAKEIRLSEKDTQFNICYQGKERKCKSQLVGKFNVYNFLAAISVGLCYGLSLETCLQGLKNFKNVPGRLEKVKEGIFVDYAHSEDALRNVLETLREIKKGRLITVFGCGGDRDREKRPKMGKVVSELSDVTIVTSDNPRNEDPEVIVEEILAGCEKPVSMQLDREEAIRFALEQKKPDDLVLIAGKGHEKEQIFAHQIIPFDDAETVRKICEGACTN
ncbi:MAG: UDP-N-acetylmuramoyl-L-alanyl-D-glutamate--2,6-diaminopimelate ligase [Chlamydiae bacterium]|nr:UDP-N-acetylmuramoyl-L-alanyl-D-glutamate--2,6-diaminopimelate ligase [Chlamydiota bacterium]